MTPVEKVKLSESEVNTWTGCLIQVLYFIMAFIICGVVYLVTK